MKINLSDNFFRDRKITEEEYLLLLFLATKADYQIILDSLVRKDLVTRQIKPEKVFVNMNGNEIIRESAITEIDYKEYEDVAVRIKELFPKGKKTGPYPWTEGVKLICKRLALFEKKYGKYSDDEIFDATKRYVSAFNGDYTYMKTLKYFICAEKTVNGNVESTSELLTYIENKDDDNIAANNNDWTTILV